MLKLEDRLDLRESNYYRGPCNGVVRVAQPDCTKRLVTSGRNTADITSAAKNSISGWEESTFPILKEGSVPMLDSDSWTYKPDDKFLNFFDPNCNEEATNLASEDCKMSYNCFKDGDVNMLCGSEPENQECSYLSYDGWPSYVDDFNGLMRGGDSSLGLETNEDMSWFSSSAHAIGGSGDASELGFKSFCSGSSPLKSTIKHHESDTCRVPNTLTPDFDAKNVLSSYFTSCYSSYGSLAANAERKSAPASEKQPMKRSSHSSPKVTAVISEQNVEKCRWQHQMQSESYAAVADLTSIPKQLHQTSDGIEGQCEVENVSTELPDVDIDSSVVLESSRMSTLGSVKVSVEEASFLQLQYVMEQLDIRTKLCIRDSLYRLARSAEQRHEEELSRNSSRDERDDKGEMKSEELNERPVFVDVETDTNPIDRSIAQLLFLKPTEEISLDSNASIDGVCFGNVLSRKMLLEGYV
ncbi:hypothetical protein AQUCO_01000226v1 [Aquilegia coerulea]|uniref:Protein LNK1-like n=1 Tax=Aquilegia coerulea TaxID=218851 RepID=A0A2G5E923_AQUCA|nr:hypothetical protein AQUCO_01000226v1 [Aquilegia coerulea]